MSDLSYRRLKTAAAVIGLVQSLVVPMDKLPGVIQEYWDTRNANSGDDWTVQELEALGVTPSLLGACIQTLENLKKFFDGSSPSNDVYRVPVNQARHVGYQI